MNLRRGQNRLYTLSIILFLMILIYQGGYFLLPAIRHYIDQKSEVQDLALLQSNRKWHENYLQLKEEKDTKANYLKGLENKLLYEDELDHLLVVIHQISLAAETELVRFQPGPVFPEAPYVAQNTQVYLKGPFSHIMYFLQLIQDLRIYQQLHFAIQPYEEQLQCTISFHLYYKPGKRGG